MTSSVPAIRSVPATSGGLLSRIGWALHDAWIITKRDLMHSSRQPWLFLLGLMYPILMLFMFGLLLGGGMSVPGGGNYIEFLIPGMFTLTMFFGLETTYTAVTTDINRGVTDRFRSMPIAGSAVVLGRNIADLLNSVLSLVVLMAASLVFGWTFHNGIPGLLIAFLLLLLLRFSILWIGIYLAIKFNTPEAVMVLYTLIWPIGFLSNIYTSTETMPTWLAVISDWNPLSATAYAARFLFGNPGGTGDSFVAQNALMLAVAWPLVLVLIFMPLSVRAYQNLSK